MKKILVYIVSLSMLFSNSTIAMAAQENTSKDTKTTITAKTGSISFDPASLNTKVGYFKAYKFQGISPTAINEMSSSIREVATSASSTSELTAEARQTAALGQKSIQATVSAVNALHDELDNSKQVINELADNTKHIGSILDVITSIADQTNLLALNAAIEAARAGEQGRGFAVVADEIRSLALKTRTSTDEIQQMISKLQSSASTAVTTMDHGADLSETCRTQANAAGEVFGQINDMLHHVTDASHQIATAVEEQAYVTEDINRSIHNIRELADTSTTSSHTAVDRIALLVERLQGLCRLINQFQR